MLHFGRKVNRYLPDTGDTEGSSTPWVGFSQLTMKIAEPALKAIEKDCVASPQMNRNILGC